MQVIRSFPSRAPGNIMREEHYINVVKRLQRVGKWITASKRTCKARLLFWNVRAASVS